MGRLVPIPEEAEHADHIAALGPVFGFDKFPDVPRMTWVYGV